VVTSRLGRSGQTHSRAGSAASGSCSAGSDEPETIQWKRGNVLGKGAYGTVGLVFSSSLVKILFERYAGIPPWRYSPSEDTPQSDGVRGTG